MAKKREEVVEEAQEVKKGFSIKSVLLILVLAMVGFMGYTFLRQSGFLAPKEDVPKKARAKEPIIYTFEGNFLVNLADKDNLRYLKAVISVALSSQRAEDELRKKSVEVRDAIIMILSAQTSEDLATPEGKERLKTLIAERINSMLTQGEVESVYFLDFVMQ
ncbi:MAG: flagellar basal body-associated FliL family protein [Candidatus Caldatribacterium sp.]|uniref:flagellar basal body-associated FliL family protein n=1 Tax=Candidatus Caldatribacterium sp. TaxID=2282143 RepID=UPI0029976EBA|nr:flagellar basal body-associated FliL family protein [Candidatus Caldatribacterium sp.]MCX7731139.1 flagellar basal body-associated FliL family protein [Candidatus Caldatribacterium sp.]MDW8081004.1 flagellar basal body-associated protein FliL [Candidatus Calescibacterium sp.]